MSQPVGTLVKAMDVLDALGEAAPIGVLDLSRRLELDKSAVSRILTTFKTRGYVRVNDDGRYDLGLRLLELGQAMHERLPFRDSVVPHVDAIAHEAGETAFAMHYSQGQIASLYESVSTKEIRLSGQSGLRASPWSHPAGIAILAHRDEDRVLDDLSAARRKFGKALPKVDSFRRELAAVRKRGYAVQRDSEKCLISAPVLNEKGSVDAALMMGGPAFRLTPSRTKSRAMILIQHAKEVSCELGWIPFAIAGNPAAGNPAAGNLGASGNVTKPGQANGIGDS